MVSDSGDLAGTSRRISARALCMILTAAIALAALPLLTGVQIADSAAAADDGYVRVGWLGSVYNWNPLSVEMIEDYVACYLMYSTLYMYDQDWNMLVPSLATGIDYDVHANGSMTTTITITESAYFRNVGNLGDTSHQLTAHDVVFTFWLAKNYTGATFDWYLQDYSDFKVIDEFTFSLWCPYEKAILINDICDIPILPKYVWQNVSNPLASINPMDQTAQMTVSGAFVFESMLKDAWYKFKRAPNYHGAIDYPGYMDVDEGLEGIIYTVYSDIPGMCLEMNEGTEDTIVLTGDIDSFQNVLGNDPVVNVSKVAVQENGICDIAINAIPYAFRAGSYCTGNPVLLDPLVRKAIMMTLDKDYINNTILRGLVVEADSVIDPGFWHKTIENPVSYGPAEARTMLEENGWEDLNGNGLLEATASVWGVQEGLFVEGTELANIRCQAPDTDVNYGYIATAWQDWAEQAGIGFVSSVESEITMINQAWYQADYDIWIWHWGWGPEPIGGALSVWMTSEIEQSGDNCQMPMGEWWAGYWNYTDCPYINASMIEEYNMDAYDFRGFSSFDQNISIAMKTMDIYERKAILDDLQQAVYDSYTENPPYYDLGLYAFTDERFLNWGDWKAHPGRTFTSGLLWIWYDLEPAGWSSPRFDTPLNSIYECRRLDVASFSVTVSDPDNDSLTIEWDFGDGFTATDSILENTLTPTEVTQTHVYNTISNYTLTVTVSDPSTAPDAYTAATVTVMAEDDNPPRVDTPAPVACTYGYINDAVQWTVQVGDNESGGSDGYGLDIWWSWDDGTMTSSHIQPIDNGTAVTDVQTHAWSGTGNYTISVSVWDGYNDPSDPYHNLTAVYAGFEVRANTPPVADAGDDQPDVLEGDTVTFDGSGSSDDVLVTNFTWTFTYDGVDRVLYGESPTFVFDIAGEYVVNLTVTDQLGLKGYDEMTVTVVKESGSMGTLLLAGAAVALIGAAVVALLLIKRRGDGTGRAPPPET